MFDSVARVGELVEDLDRRLVGRDYRLSGTIRLTTTDTLAEHFLHAHLKSFQARYPEIVLELVTSNVMFDLSRREADVALRPGDDPPQHLVGRNLANVGWAVYGAKTYLRERSPPRRASQLAQHAVVCGDESLAAVPAMRWLKTQVPESAVVYRASSFGMQFAAAREGFGLALLPCVLADSAPELKRVLGPIKALTTGLWLLTHADLRHAARIRAFMSFVTEAIRADKDRLAG